MEIHCPKCSSKEVMFNDKRQVYVCMDCQHFFKHEEKRRPRRIFLSYGHDENADLAVKLKKDLEAQDHEVWFDLDRLKSGVDWEAYIEEGLHWVSEEPEHGLIVFLMTPHSTRRPDGFCLNELSRGLTRGLSVVPVMVVWCEPPLSICRIQWLDMRDCVPLLQKGERYPLVLDKLSEAVDHRRVEVEGAQTRLLQLLDPLPFDSEMYQRRDVLNAFGALISLREGRLHPFHRTALEWLTSESNAERYFVSVDEGHQRLAAAGWAEYKGGVEQLSAYAREHLPAHLIATGRWDDLRAFLSEPAIMEQLMSEEKQYALMGYWQAVGERLDLVGVYEEAIARYEQSGASQEELASIIHKTASFFAVNALYNQAESLYERALKIREQALGEKHPDTAESLNDFAGMYIYWGAYQKAEPLFRRALAIREEVLGPEHQDTATSLNDLGVLRFYQYKHSEAEALYKRALEIWKKVLGPEHPDTATALSNLANLYSNQGRNAEAEPLYQRALEINEKVLGANHPDTATFLNNLAGFYANQGRHAEAESLHQRALQIREKVLGSEHPDTAITRYNLANLYFQQKKFSKAEPLYRRELEVREKTQGMDNLETIICLNNLAVIHFNQAQYAAAEPLYRRALEISERVLGPEDQNTRQVRQNLEQCLQKSAGESA